MEPLSVLYEADGSSGAPLSADLASLYGPGPLFPERVLYANFVSSLDGVAAVDDERSVSRLISGGSEADRFVMGLLRALADAILVGAGTLRSEPRHVWTPERAHRPLAAAYRELRRALGKPPTPVLAVLSASGDLDPGLAALQPGALVLTTHAGASRLAGRLPAASRACALGDGPELDLDAVLAALAAEGHRQVLTEGGPSLIGGLLRANLLDEVFLTLSPLLAGRDREHRWPGFVEGLTLLPDSPRRATLLSLRQAGSHLLLRYAVR